MKNSLSSCCAHYPTLKIKCDNTIAFHCQQAVEKYIKAILVFKDIEFVRSHDLIYLLELLTGVAEIKDEKYQNAVLLNGFSVRIRYPNKIEEFSKEELEDAISISQEFRNFAIEQIGIEEISTGNTKQSESEN
ncbi:MAG: hypothetical protein HW421_1085 [Ignavibacteria bacterium]|nr:hypothetical protein [Ignavibacteria bacterium]